MFSTTLKRIIKSGFISFWRNKFISLSSVVVMVITLFIIGSFIFSTVLFNSALDQIKEKVDINVYFITTAKEVDILALKGTLSKMTEVSSVEYTSREQALENFRQRHKDDQLTLRALDELGDNPLGAILNIRAKQTSQYASIAEFLDAQGTLAENGVSNIDKINYHQNKVAIDRLSKIINMSEKFGWGVALIFILFSLIITFNTIRLAIYVSKDEISVMRLIGATNMYVRGPFVVEGVLYGSISALLTIIVFAPITYWLKTITQNMFAVDIFQYYISHLFQFVFIILLAGILLGAISSYLAVSKYLRN